MTLDVSSASALELAQSYAAKSTPWFRANMVLTLDGHYADPSGSSRGLSSSHDLRVLLLLRALSDVVIVGASTAQSEKYASLSIRPEFSEITESAPRLCVISRHLSFHPNASFLNQTAAPCIVITEEQVDSEWIERRALLEDRCEVITLTAPLTGSSVVDTLHQEGLNQLVCEGGPHTLALFMAQGCIQELDLTLAPIIAGSYRDTVPLGNVHSEWASTYFGHADNHHFLQFLRPS